MLWTSCSGVAGRANDGDTNGAWGNGSVTHTANENQPWWEVALADRALINEVVLYNRTGCCLSRLSDVNVFISETPMGDMTLDQVQNQLGVWHVLLAGTQPSSVQIPADITGRYVRVQLAGRNPLSLAEVEIFGAEL